MFAPFHPGTGWLHRLAPLPKLVSLTLAGTALFFVTAPWAMLALAGLALALFPLAGLPPREALAQLRPVLLFGALIVVAQLFLNGVAQALLVGARLVTLLLLAGLVTLTTRTSAMIETLERALRPLAALGLNPRKGALALSLSLRFIPLLAQIVTDVREAQRVRGLEHDLVALAIPTLIRSVKLTDELADAIEARGFDPNFTPPPGDMPAREQDERKSHDHP
jgi:biotin transport system permease protein